MFSRFPVRFAFARGARVATCGIPLLIAGAIAGPLFAADPPPAATVVEIKVLEKLMKCQMQTQPYDFSDQWFFRRGDIAGVNLVLSPEYKGSTHDLKIIATHTFDGAPQKITMTVEDSLPAVGWGAALTHGYKQGANTVEVLVFQIPGDAPVGEYAFEASVEPKGAPNQATVKAFPKPVVLLFNPWSAKDKDVHYTLDAPRKEFVLETEGRVYTVKPANDTEERRSGGWSFDQFDKVTIKVTLKQLEGLSAADRSSALKVCRHLIDRAAAKETDGSGGILIGRWAFNYPGGQRPTAWTRSKEIFAEFDTTGNAVKYGQCWVFAGVLTSMARCLGIPAHTHSTFDVGWEKGKKDPKELDTVWTRDENGDLRISGGQSDGWWTYHAWCDVRLRHEAAEPTWQSCDVTYGTKVGYPPFGPAPLSKIKAKLGGDFDVQFFSTAFDGDRQLWFNNHKLPQKPKDKVITGWYSTMKKVGSNGWTDITAFYKVPEAEPTPLPGSSDLQIELFHNSQVAAGESLEFDLFLHNGGEQPRHLAITRRAQYQAYDGEPGELLLGEASMVDLAAGETLIVPWSISGSQTVDFAASMEDIVLDVAVQDLDLPDPELRGEPTFLLLESFKTTILPVDVELVLDQAGPFDVGGGAMCTASFVNPLKVPTQDAVVIFSAGDGAIVGGAERLEVPLKPVAPGAIAEVTMPVLFNRPGKHIVLATVVATGFRCTSALVSAEVSSPDPLCPADINGDGVVNGADLGLLLAAFGPGCDCECVNPDLNGDGHIDGADMGLLLGAWGPCQNE